MESRLEGVNVNRMVLSALLVWALLLSYGLLWGVDAQDLNLGVLSHSLTGGSYSCVGHNSTYAFVSTGYGVKIFDISDPSLPVEIAQFPTDGLAISLSASEDFLFVCDESVGLLVYDISDIYNPRLTDSIYLEGDIRSVCPYENYLYVAMEIDGLQIVDFSDPENLELVDVIYVGGEAIQAATLDGWLYLTLGVAGLGVYDIADPEAPENMLYWNTTGGHAGGVYIFPNGDYLVMADAENGAYVLDLEFPWVPTWSATVSLDTASAGSVAGGVDFGVCSYMQRGIQSFDILGNELDYLEIGYKCGFVHTIEDYIYLCQSDSGLLVINVEDPYEMSIESELLNRRAVFDVTVVNDIAYVANMEDGLTVVDVSDPANPVFIESIATGFWAKDVFVLPNNEYLYVADFFTGINIFDLADPLHPVHVNTVPSYPDTGAHSFDFHDGSLYLSVWDRGLNVFEVIDPVNPELTWYSPDTTDWFRKAAVSDDGQHVYGTSEPVGLLVYSVYSPDSIVYEYTYTGLTCPYDIQIDGDYAYIADFEDGLYVLDISDHANIFKVDSLALQEAASGVELINDNLLAVSDWTAGITLVDISNPADLGEIDRHETPGYAYNACSAGDYLYLCDQYAFIIFDIYSPPGVRDEDPGAGLPEEFVRLNPAYPNPFNATTNISFVLYKPGHVRVSVYNIAGEEITSLCDRNFRPGAHQLKLEADDLASGLYFISLESGLVTQTQKVLFVK